MTRGPLRGLSAKIFLATAVVIILVLGGALLLTKYQADRAADESIAKALDATHSAIQDALTGRSHTLQQVAAGLARVPTYVSRVSEAIGSGNRANLLDQADEFRAQTGAAWTLITDNTGQLKAWSLHREQSDEDFSQGSIIGLALEGQQTEGLWVEPEDGKDVLYQAAGVPIVAPGGNTIYGVLVAALPIDSEFAAELKRHTNSEIVFFLRDSTGQPQVALSTLAPSAVAGAIGGLPLDSLFTPEAASATITSPSGEETWIGVAGPMRTADGYPLGGYAAFRSRQIELAPYTTLQRTVLVVFGVGLVLAVLSSLLVARQVTRPVKQLVEATREVSEGKFTGSIPVSSQDEIGELAAAFDRMLQDLKGKQDLVDYLSRAGGTVAASPVGAELATRVVSPAVRTGVLQPGLVLSNRYEIKEVLGSGGMGVVYRAFDRELHEMVAIKTLKPEVIQADRTSLERFKQEIRLARRITHRNVLRTHDFGEVDGMYFITMEYAEGTSLGELLKKRGQLPVGVTLTIGKQLCRALEVAHEQGVVHRDIKPQNLMIDPAGFLKVMDFGIARLAEGKRPDTKGLTEVGAVIGTPEYMSPEQLTGEELDGRADLYASGAVLFECVTGRAVFTAPSITVLIARHLQDPPPDPRSLNPEVPESLSRIILKALAKERSQRWQSAGEMYQALEKC